MEHKASWLKNYIEKCKFYCIVLVLFPCIMAQAMDPNRPNPCDQSESSKLLAEVLWQEEAHSNQVAPSFNDLALMEYITTKNVAGVQDALKSPIQINLSCAEYHGHTPLSEAVASANTEIVDLVLGQPGIDIDADAGRGYRAVHIAALQGQADMVTKLCSQGASLAVINGDGNTPFHEAIKHKENDFACVYNLVSVVSNKSLEQFYQLESLALHFFRCCFKDRQSEGPCGLGALPKDLRFMLCRYYVSASVAPELQSIVQGMLKNKGIDTDFLIETQLTYLQPVLETKNNHDWIPCQLLRKDQLNYLQLRNILNPKERSCRRLAIEKYIKETSKKLNLSSTPHNSEQSQTQPIKDTAPVTK